MKTLLTVLIATLISGIILGLAIFVGFLLYLFDSWWVVFVVTFISSLPLSYMLQNNLRE